MLMILNLQLDIFENGKKQIHLTLIVLPFLGFFTRLLSLSKLHDNETSWCEYLMRDFDFIDTYANKLNIFL